VSTMTPGELRAIVAGVFDIEIDRIADVVLVSRLTDGFIGVASSACCEGATAGILGAGITRSGNGLHVGEEIPR
jgi:hypothetical protein